jgi:hypothetical protein
MSSLHQAARQLQVLTGGVPSLGPENQLYALERAMALVQHHDGVSGTEKQHVRAATPGSGEGGGDVSLVRIGPVWVGAPQAFAHGSP